jgi:hypothetical protein
MKRSDILYLILLVMFICVLIIGFTVPQNVLDNNEIILFLIVGIMGFLWLRAYIDATKGN